MFNSKLKKENIEKFEGSVKKYDLEVKNVNYNSIQLFESRMKSIQLIELVELYINMIANTPKRCDMELVEVKQITKNFNDELINVKNEANKATKVSSGIAATGVAAGASVAMFAPTAAMAIATTFGTASTGVAISTLSGAAATNAALAWLGGGAIVAGGGGIAAGNALLALAGPVGWTIGGVGLLGSSIFLNSKNKKIANEALEKAKEVEEKVREFKIINLQIKAIKKLTDDAMNGINKLQLKLKMTGITDYNLFSEEQKFELSSLINDTKALANLLKNIIK